jgi:hypothetical protein
MAQLTKSIEAEKRYIDSLRFVWVLQSGEAVAANPAELRRRELKVNKGRELQSSGFW